MWIKQEYSALFEGAGNNPGDKTLEDKFFEHEVSVILLQYSKTAISCCKRFLIFWYIGSFKRPRVSSTISLWSIL